MSTPEQRQQWRELAAAATPGEWGVDSHDEVIVIGYCHEHTVHDVYSDDAGDDAVAYCGNSKADAAFIAAARAAVPALLADVDALTAELRQLRYDYEQDTHAARKYAAEDRTFAADDLARVTRERDALAAELEHVRAQLDHTTLYYNVLNKVVAVFGKEGWYSSVLEIERDVESLFRKYNARKQPNAAHTPTPGTR